MSLRSSTFIILLSLLLMSTVSHGQSGKPASDYLGVPGPIAFENKSFTLNWTSHPAANFYKQEYLVKGDVANTYKRMILMDVITGETNIKNVVGTKLAELKKLKESNPVVNYEVIDNPKTGEYIVDFLLTTNAPDGTISIVERNIYRYKTFTDKGGKKGIILFGISTRGYGADVTKFLTTLKTNRKDGMNEVAQFKIPEVTVNK